VHWVFWAMAGAAALHFAEECFFGCRRFGRDTGGRFAALSPGRADLAATITVNAVFVLLGVAGALVGLEKPIFSLSIAALFLINTVTYLIPMAITRSLPPGAFSAVFLFAPLSIYAFHVADTAGKLNALTVLGAFLLGLLWMSLPIGASLIRSSRMSG
jgi:hypothetical protein